MSLKTINAAIAELDPCVDLERGQGYHYYIFDNSADGECKMFPSKFKVGDSLVYDSESIMVPYLRQQSDERWIADGIDFGRKVREKAGLPLPLAGPSIPSVETMFR